jgi:2-polyprenyl-3-methyl-5-hydroxy-6-metoxy-1,4-benzoquinol methylase
MAAVMDGSASNGLWKPDYPNPTPQGLSLWTPQGLSLCAPARRSIIFGFDLLFPETFPRDQVVSAYDISGYKYGPENCNCSHEYLLPALERELESLQLPEKGAFDLGCGNGSVAQWLTTRGYRVSGVDPSTQGLEHAKRAYPDLDLRIGSAYEPLHETFGTFSLVISLEVVEHLYSPRRYAACVRDLLQPSGYAIISTP